MKGNDGGAAGGARVVGRSARDFPVTSWTLLSIVQAGGADARAALGELIARYSAAVEAFLRDALRVTAADAQDLAQDFFADKILSGQLLARYRRGKGSFRPYLKEALRNYVRSRLRADGADKRRPGGGLLSPDDLPRGLDNVAATPQASPESAFHAAWVRRLLGEALTAVRAECTQEGLAPHFAVFVGRHLSDDDEPKWSELGAPFGWDEKQARNRAEVVAARFRAALRELVAAEVGSEQLALDELEALVALL